MNLKLIKLLFLLLLPAALSAAAQEFDHPAIQYEKGPVSDPVWRLQQRLDSGKEKLSFDENLGWLPDVLRALKVPVESQILNFGKTSFQTPRISPRWPRAIYFNDQVSVGHVHSGDVLELTAVDAKQGVIFYTLEQESAGQPRFVRRNDCLQCHQNTATLNVPGLMIRSIYPEPSGMPLFHAGGFVTDHHSPFKERWGGWYVTGTSGAQTHLGNAFARDPQRPTELDTSASLNLTSIKERFNAADYLSPHSDIVALLVIEHQARMTNLITRANWETRKALHDRNTMVEALGELTPETAASTARRIKSACEPLLEYLLFTDEAALTAPVKGTSGFAEMFAKQGPFDARGRSLRQFDLERRLFRYPCSYLIYSEAFDGLPAEARDYIYRRLWDVLNGKDASASFAQLSAADRQAVREILLATKKGLPDYWRK